MENASSQCQGLNFGNTSRLRASLLSLCRELSIRTEDSLAFTILESWRSPRVYADTFEATLNAVVATVIARPAFVANAKTSE